MTETTERRMKTRACKKMDEEQIVERSEDVEEKRERRKEKVEQMRKRNRELKPYLRTKVDELEKNKNFINDKMRELWYNIYSKKTVGRKEMILDSLRVWPTKEEACRVTGCTKEEMDEIVIKTSEKEEEKISIFKEFIEDMTRNKIDEWSDGISIIMNHGETVQTVIFQYPFGKLLIKSSSGMSIPVRRVSRQKRVIRKYSKLNRVGDLKEEEILLFTVINSQNLEEIRYILVKNEYMVDNLVNKVRYHVLEIAEVEYEILEPSETVSKTERKRKEIEKFGKMIESYGNGSEGLREMMYRYQIYEEMMKGKMEIEKEIGCNLYLSQEVCKQKILSKGKINFDIRPDFLYSYLKV